MKKLTKMLISVMLVLVLAVTTFAFTGVFSSAQAIAKDVSFAFTGADQGDWVTLKGTTIQDAALYATFYNDSKEDIILTDISDTGLNITYSGWSNNIIVAKGQPFPIGIYGTTANNAVLTVTVTYRIKGKPAATSETLTAYIYCSTQDYTENTSTCHIDSGFDVFGVESTYTMKPVSTSSTSYSTTKKDQPTWYLVLNAEVKDPANTVGIYIDGSKYKTWSDFNLEMTYTEKDRAYGRMTSLYLKSNSNTGSFTFNGVTVDKDNKEVTSTYDGESSGFFWQISEKEVASLTFSGVIPTEASSQIIMKMTGCGTASKLYGVLNGQTAALEPSWTINVYNNNKSALRDRIKEIEMEGLNKDSYESGWNNFETALKSAYTTLGTIKKSATDVSNALKNLNTAYGKLKRFAVVVTNHYYYQGTNGENPVAMREAEYNLQVKNNGVYEPTVLANGDYTEPFNRTRVVESKTISVDANSNYTDYVDQYYWYVDISALQAAIDEYENTNPYDGEGEEQELVYYEDTWRAYTKAYNKAVEDINNPDLFQDDIDDTTAKLVAARKGLKRIVPDTEWLNEGIAWAKQIISGNFVDDFGYETETFGYDWRPNTLFSSTYSTPLFTNLVAAYNEAVEVTEDPNYTKSQVIRVTDQLWDAINDLRTVDMTTKGLKTIGTKKHADIDRYGYFISFSNNLDLPTGLRVVFNDIIDSPDATTDDYQLNEEEFTADSWEMLQDALYGDYEPGAYACAETMESYPVNDSVGELSVPAYSMINNIWFLSSQADYNACRDNLIDKVENLEYEVDASELEDLRDSLKDTDTSIYTPSSAANFAEKLALANEILDKIDEGAQLYKDADAATQARIDDACTQLQAAYDELVEVPYIESKTEDVVIGDDNVISGEEIGQTVRGIKADLIINNESEDTQIRVFYKGKEIGANEKVGTGYEVKLYLEDEVCQSFTLVIKGDITCDVEYGPRIDHDDFLEAYNYAFKKNTGLTDIQLDAADVNGDGVVDLCDAIMIKQMQSL